MSCTTVSLAEWRSMATSSPAKAPFWSMMILPPPPSSAGQPKTLTVPPSSSRTLRSASPAPTAMAHIRLWPQAWPMPGTASNSPKIPMLGPGLPLSYTPLTLVATPPTPVSTWKPKRRSCSLMAAQAWCSSKLYSGWDQMVSERATSSGRMSATRWRTRSLYLSILLLRYFFILGSSTSRTPSPSRLKPSTVMRMKMPE